MKGRDLWCPQFRIQLKDLGYLELSVGMDMFQKAYWNVAALLKPNASAENTATPHYLPTP